jgi:hypothetical protein
MAPAPTLPLRPGLSTSRALIAEIPLIWYFPPIIAYPPQHMTMTSPQEAHDDACNVQRQDENALRRTGIRDRRCRHRYRYLPMAERAKAPTT